MNPYVNHFFKSLALGFAVFLVLLGINLALGANTSLNAELLKSFAYTMIYTVSIYMGNMVVFRWLDRVFATDRFSKKRLVVGFASSFLVAMVMIFCFRAIDAIALDGQSLTVFLKNEDASDYLVSAIITLVITITIYAIYFYKSYQENKVKEQKIIAGAASARFESLKNQIDPHFLFNSLNVLSSLIEENPDSAQRFTTSLSKIYRYVLEQKDKELVPVSEELGFAKTYMNLLKMRFENSLFYELPEQAPNPDAKVVPLSLQLLLENTVKHNVVSEQRPLHIRIYFEGDYLVISNDLQKKQVLQERQGVGLQNIVSRYNIITRRKVLVEETADKFSVHIPVLTRQVAGIQTENSFEEENYARIQKKVEDIRGFYGNLITYCVVITGLAILNLVTYSEFLWFLFPAAGWGIGVIVHGLSVFNYVPFLGRDWEEKKIRELIEKENSGKWN